MPEGVGKSEIGSQECITVELHIEHCSRLHATPATDLYVHLAKVLLAAHSSKVNMLKTAAGSK